MPTPPADRLVMATHEFYPHRGGIAVYAAEMAAAAAALGYRVEVWAPALPTGQVEKSWPFQVKRLRIDGSHGLRNQWRMARELQAQRDGLQNAILYIPEPGPLLSMLVLQFFDTLPPGRLMITLHGSEILKMGMRPLMSWSTRRLLARADRVSVVSRHTQQLLDEFFPGLASRVVLIPGALRSDFRSVAPVVKPTLTGRRIVILTVARLHPRKGQLQVINALKTLPGAVQAQVEYWVVGGHSKERYEQALRAAIATAAFPVKFLGDVPDDQLGGIFAQADIFAMTSMPHKLSIEGYGLVYLEAGAHGLPVVAHAIGGVPEAVRHNETGLLVPPNDSIALAAALARLVEDEKLRQRLGAAGRELAGQRTWRDNALALFGPPSGTNHTS